MKRLKLVMFGDTGTRKTRTAIAFPKPFVIDLEGGTDWYTDEFRLVPKKDVVYPTTRSEIIGHIATLARGGHGYRTFVIDPFSVLWELQVSYWTEVFRIRKPGAAGNRTDFYEVSAKDWVTIKEDWKKIMRSLTALDMSVILTCREKTKYKDNAMMVSDGVVEDAEKNTKYWPDVHMRLYHYVKRTTEGGAENVVKAALIKDRTHRLPTTDFELDYGIFEKAYGDLLTAEAKAVQIDEPVVVVEQPAQPVVATTVAAPRTAVTLPKASADQIEAFVELVGPTWLNLTHEDVQAALGARGVKTPDELTHIVMSDILKKLKEQALKPANKKTEAKKQATKPAAKVAVAAKA